MRRISLKYAGKCVKCGRRMQVGELAYWEKGKGIWHLDCPARTHHAPRLPYTNLDYPTRASPVSASTRSTGKRTTAGFVLIAIIVIAAGFAAWSYTTAYNPFRQKWTTSGAISYTVASSHVGEHQTVEGTVVRTYFDSISGTTFLDFCFTYEGCFYAVIFASHRSNFPFSPESFYLYKEVRITGTIEFYARYKSAQIIVTSPSQIEVAYLGFNYP